MVAVVKVPVDVRASGPRSLDEAWSEFRGHIQASQGKPALAGSIERRIESRSKELLLAAAREAFQAQADGCAPRCPRCGGPLRDVERAERTILTQWGEATIRRAYGRCPRCGIRVAPADAAMGLEPHEPTSPDLAEKLSWLATQMPPAQAAEVFKHLTGQSVSASRVERQAKKKGTQALAERERDCQRALSTTERFEFSKENKPEGEPEEFTLVIVPDAWKVRERDDWGRTQALRDQGQAPQRWHDVKSARVFRLDRRVEISERAALLESRCVATRGGPEVFSQLLWTEALRMGLMRAKDVLVIADGAAWIWNMADERFPRARGTLDFYHASQHLWAVAHALAGGDEERARQWVRPVLHQLRHGEHGKVLKRLHGLSLKHAQSEFADTLRREWNYFETHQERLDYGAKADRGEPIGSGSVESLCAQYQIRFKRPGQFWLTDNAERFLELENRRRNDRWASLWPHLQHSEN
jgi:hypothetical protein